MRSADIRIFSLEISNFCYIKKYRYRLYFNTYFLNLLAFFESLKVVLINIVAILMMPANLATMGLLKLKPFWNKGYGVITFVRDLTNKILLRDSNCIVDVVIWPKFGNFSIFMKEVVIITILWGFEQKIFFEGWAWFRFTNLWLALDMVLKFYSSVAVGLKLKVRKFKGLFPTFVEVTKKKLIGWAFLPLFTPFLSDKCNSWGIIFLILLWALTLSVEME